MEKMTLEFGYRGKLIVDIKFMDQNCVEHTRTFVFTIFGEKPTCLNVKSLDDDSEVIFSTNTYETMENT